MNRVYIKTYGCQMNERDSEAVAAQLRTRGYSIVSDEKEADVILLNTCSVRDLAEQKAIGKAGHLLGQKRRGRNLLVGIMGCMAQNRGDDLLDHLPDLDLIAGTQKFHRVPDHLENLMKTMEGQGPRPSTIVDIDEESGSQNTIREHVTDKRQVSAFVSIMQGCNMNCAFCIVPKTRGNERARPIESIVEEVQELVAAGTREVTLLGQIVTSYGRREIPKVGGKSPFVQLIEALHAIRDLARIRFTSPHPIGFQDDLIEAFRDCPKLGKYVHLPLQSGSDRILRAMNRPYSVQRFQRIVDKLRAVVPAMCFSTDVIVGFPGETRDDFELTRRVFTDVAFDMAFIFKYSPRSGTVSAEEMVDDVPPAEKEWRNQELLACLEKQSLARNHSFVNSIEEVLVEGPARRGEGMLVGRNPSFRKIIFPGPQRLIGELIDVQITSASATTLLGQPYVQADRLDETEFETASA